LKLGRILQNKYINLFCNFQICPICPKNNELLTSKNTSILRCFSSITLLNKCGNFFGFDLWKVHNLNDIFYVEDFSKVCAFRCTAFWSDVFSNEMTCEKTGQCQTYGNALDHPLYKVLTLQIPQIPTNCEKFCLKNFNQFFKTHLSNS